MNLSDQKPKTNKTVNLLWTGGWDSTFRLLTLISEPNNVVQPYYIIDRNRRSLSIELMTMQKIMDACSRQASRFPGTVLQPIHVEGEDIAPNPEMTRKFRRLAEKGRLGTQYDWLPRFAAEAGLRDLELSIERNGGLFLRLCDHVKERKNLGNTTFVVDTKKDSDLSIFNYFEFPLLYTSKADMDAISRKNYFINIMEMTWFCLKPAKDKWACGICRPCRFVMAAGLGRRVGWRGRFRYRRLRLGESASRLSAHARASIPLPIKRALRPYIHGRTRN